MLVLFVVPKNSDALILEIHANYMTMVNLYAYMIGGNVETIKKQKLNVLVMTKNLFGLRGI